MRRPIIVMLTCDQCGRTFSEAEFAETTEENLCQWCASGIEEDDCDEPDWSYDTGYDGDEQ